MNRADRLAAGLKRILEVCAHPEARRIAQLALDEDYPWPGDMVEHYHHPEDARIAWEWLHKHQMGAGEIVYFKGRPLMAVYFEPVAEHYQQARERFVEFCRAIVSSRQFWWSEEER